ncbi:MAG TPA: zf-HC2 domain-containing protein [Caulobacteraceae bacterium]|nr:zf-HC2 domain-containing protein [Caulobacteraceae bacterium]
MRWNPSRGGDHRETRELLPWYVTGRLDPDEAGRVKAHMEVCGACRAELAAERRLREAVLSAPPPEEAIELPPRRRIPVVAGVVGAMGAIAASLAVAVVSFQPARAPVRHQIYRTLGDTSATGLGEVVVVFDPACSTEQMRQALARAHARVIDGPTTTGAYVLRIPRGGRQAAITALRSSPDVRLAESLGGEE